MFDWQGQGNDHITDFCPPRSNQLTEQQHKIKACLDQKHYILTLQIFKDSTFETLKWRIQIRIVINTLCVKGWLFGMSAWNGK